MVGETHGQPSAIPEHTKVSGTNLKMEGFLNLIIMAILGMGFPLLKE